MEIQFNIRKDDYGKLWAEWQAEGKAGDEIPVLQVQKGTIYRCYAYTNGSKNYRLAVQALDEYLHFTDVEEGHSFTLSVYTRISTKRQALEQYYREYMPGGYTLYNLENMEKVIPTGEGKGILLDANGPKDITLKEPVGASGLCNTASLNIYTVGDEKVLVGMNNARPRWYKLYTTSKGTYFNWGGHRQYLHEFMEV